MTARAAVTRLLRFFLRIFYRRIEMIGLERVPPDGAVVFAVNHPNGLVDPLFLLCFAPRPVSFLAKAPLFRYPVIGWFARAFDSIPVYRKQDQTTGSNAETFARARELLARGGSIAIFPEGTTHSDPRLRELKTGAARIALGASIQPMRVIPTGIYYTAKQTFRSAALVVFGTSLDVAPAVDTAGEPDHEAVEQLTAAIEEGLDAVTLQADSAAALELIARAEDIFSGDPAQSLAEELELRRRFIDGYHYLRARDPVRLAQLESAVTRFAAELGRARLEPNALRPRFEGRTIFRVLVLLPLAVAGALLHYPTYRLVGFLAHRFSKGEREVVATIKSLASMLLFPLTWLLLAGLTAWRLGVVAGVLALALLPLLGWLGLRVFEDLDDLVGHMRALSHRLFRRSAYERLLAQRSDIRRRIAAVAEEMERATEWTRG